MPNSTPKLENRDAPTLAFRAAVKPETYDVEKRTVELVWSVGSEVRRYDWRWEEEYIERLSMDPKHIRMGRLNNGAPLLNSHCSYGLNSVLGVVESARVKDGVGTAVIRFSSRAEVEPIIKDVQDGILRNLSVGYEIHKYDKSEEKGQRIRTITDWEPYEISIVPMGADDGAKFRSLEVKQMPKEIQENQELPPGGNVASPQESEAQRAAILTAERTRCAEITKAVRTAKLDTEFAEKLIGGNVSLEAARGQIIDEMAKRNEQNHIANHVSAGEDQSDKFKRGAEAWLIQRAGKLQSVREAIRSGKSLALEGVSDKFDSGEFRGMSLLDLARRSLELQGFRTAGMTKLELAGAALGMPMQGRGMTAYNTTSDFTVLLENTLHKLLLAGYAVTPDTWSVFCRTGTVTDFRAHYRYHLGSFGSLDSLNEHGEFKQKTIPDGAKESITVTTKGNVIGITRQALVNDDMDAFSRLANMLGRASRLTIENAVYTTLALNSGAGPALNDGNPVFYARTYTNIDSSSAAPSVSSFDSARQIMGAQRDRSGNEVLDLKPAIWLGPLSKGGAARVVNNSEYDPDTANKLQRFNMVRNMLPTIVDTARLTGNRWYIFADPSIAPVYEVAFLEGQQEPALEMQEGFQFDGVQWRARLDFGVAGVDHVGAVTNAGA